MKALFRANTLLQWLAFGVGACWGWDWVQIGAQALGQQPQGLWTVVGWVSAAVGAGICWALLKDPSVNEELPTPANLMWFLPLLGFFLFKLPFPDFFFDTLHYHLFLQNPTSWNLLHHSFFPGGVGTYVWPLADHIFFLPRELLGYRLGTIVNLIVAWICFLQVLDWIGGKRLGAGALALACLSTEAILVELGSYYVDLLPIPFLLKLIRKSMEPNQSCALRQAVTCSVLALCLKMASIPMVLVSFGLWMARADNLRTPLRKVALPILVLVAFPLILLPYMLTAFQGTGNPLFPVLNKFFQSPLFPLLSFRDERWGPQSFMDFLFFPILAIFKKARLYEGAIYGGRLAFYVVPFFILLRKFYLIPIATEEKIKRERESQVVLSIIILAMMILWEWTTGYIRYALVIEILMVVLIADLYFDLRKENSFFGKRTASLLIVVLALQCGFSWVIASKRTLHDFYRTVTHSFVSDYFSNFRWVGRDQPSSLSPAIQDHLLSIHGFITDQPNGGIGSLLKPKAPLIQLALFWSTPQLEKLKQEQVASLAQRGLFTYALEQEGTQLTKTPLLKSPVQGLRFHLEDRGSIGPIPFLPSGSSQIHFYQVRTEAL